MTGPSTGISGRSLPPRLSWCRLTVSTACFLFDSVSDRQPAFCQVFCASFVEYHVCVCTASHVFQFRRWVCHIPFVGPGLVLPCDIIHSLGVSSVTKHGFGDDVSSGHDLVH